MCGFVGLIKKHDVTPHTLSEACDVIAHRGPDDAGLYISDDKHVALGFRRLSIIDLSPTGHQPMSNEDGSVWIVFNGEVYNFIELRKKLELLGHHFISRSDTETVLHGYEEWGTDVVKHLRGMFAFAIWDNKRRLAFISVDPVGIKPLYYYEKNGLFAFASELKSLLKIPEIAKEIDLDALNQYFALGYIPSEYSIIKNIKKLSPGHFLTYESDTQKTENYQEMSLPEIDTLASEEELIEKLHYLIKESVTLSMRSDVPVGVFLSGGLDSSIIATVAASISSNPLKTFSIGFNEEKYNELPYARRIAKSIASEHYEFFVTLDSIEALNKISIQYDEPFADSSALPTYYISKKASEVVKVILSGDGGDELFGGYDWYTWVKKAQYIKNNIQPFSDLVSKFAPYIPQGIKGKNFLSILGYDGLTQFMKRTFIFDVKERTKLMKKEIQGSIEIMLPEDKISEAYYSFNTDITARMQAVDFRFYLPYDCLVKVDRASMLSSLEVRPPYLDKEIIKFAFSLPEKYRIRGFKKKYLLKRLAEKILPSQFPLERKQGFCIPLREWMKGKVGSILEDSISDTRLKEFVDTDFVRYMMTVHKKGKIDNSARLWSVLMFSLWIKNYT